MTDTELLRRYAEEKSPDAFAELVRRHLGLVYQVALRHLGGDAHGAEDVAQRVFTDLARKAPGLVDRPLLAGWLHTSTRFAARQRRRDDQRRRTREQEASLMQAITQESRSALEWKQLREVIDDALHALPDRDREAILMRFFEGRDFAEIAAQLRLSQPGARTVVDRALDKMHTRLGRLGITSTVAALASTLTSHAASSAPPALAESVAATALGATAETATHAAASAGLFSLMKASSLLFAGSLAANALLSVWYVSESRAATSGGQSAAQRDAAATNRARNIALALTLPDPATTLTDPYAVGRRLQLDGYPNEAIAYGVRAAASDATRHMTPENETGLQFNAARRTRWNLSPQSPLPVRPSTPAGAEDKMAARIQAEQAMLKEVLEKFGLDRDGLPVSATHPFLSPGKAIAVRKIETEHEKKFLGQPATSATDAEFEAKITAALTPSEATQYFRATARAAREMKTLLSPLELPEETLAQFADAAIAAHRQSRDGGGGGAAQLELIQSYRTTLGDERFVQIMNDIDETRESFGPVDVLYRQAGFGATSRADRYFSTLQFLAEGSRRDPTIAAPRAAELQSTLSAGLSPEQRAAFDATLIGRKLREIAAPAAR